MSEQHINVTPFSKEETEYVLEAAKLLERSFPQSYLGKGMEEMEECLGEDRVAFKAVSEGKFLGFISSMEAYKPYGWELHPLVVMEEARTQGVGRKLTQTLEDSLSSKGVLTLFLGTDDEKGQTSLSEGNLYENLYDRMKRVENRSNHPFEFYQKMGFQVVGVIPDANGWHKPDIIMAKNIAKKVEQNG